MLKSSVKSTNVNWKRIKVGIITFCLILTLNFIFAKSNDFYNIIYFKSTFQLLRVLHDYTLGWLPIPSIYLIAPLFIGFFFYKIPKRRLWWLFSFLACLIWIINAFYLLWGFNYQQESIYKTADLDFVALDSAYITKTFRNQTLTIDSILKKHPIQAFDIDFENEIRVHQEQIINKWEIPTYGRVRVRKMFGGSLLHLRTSGIYIPHALEGHLDSGLFEIQHPFTMAHEMAHGYGFTDESVCNFIAYLTCINSETPEIRYSAELAYWRYLVRYYRYYHRENWNDEYENLNPKLKEHLDQISIHISKYKDWMPKYRDVIYDQYLKTHGVKAGIKSYDLMIQLIASYNKKQEKKSSDF